MLLQTPAAAQWQVTLKADLTELKAALPHLLRELPDPMHDAVPWGSSGCASFLQRKSLTKKSCQMGYKEARPITTKDYDKVNEPVKCPDCDRSFVSRRAVIMHGTRGHGTVADAASIVSSAT